MPDLKQSIGVLADLLLPPACPLCRKTFPRAWSEPFCADCSGGFLPLPPAHCSCCALPFQAETNSSHLCGRCLQREPFFKRVYSVGLYESTLRDAIHQFKFNQQIILDRALATLLDRMIPAGFRPDLLVPVPLHLRRLRQRGYNQSLLLAKELGRLRGWPVAARLLRKERDSALQQGLSAVQREINLQGAFSMHSPLAGERVLLIDDVMTTGTTVNSASKELLRGGAGEVQVAVIGRAAIETRQRCREKRS